MDCAVEFSRDDSCCSFLGSLLVLTFHCDTVCSDAGVSDSKVKCECIMKDTAYYRCVWNASMECLL